MYKFRLRFRLPQSFRISSKDALRPIALPQTTTGLQLRAIGSDHAISGCDELVLVGGPYNLESEARVAGEHAKVALSLTAFRLRTGFDLGADKTIGVLTKAGRKHFEMQTGTRVQSDVHGLLVYDASEDTKFLAFKAGLQVGVHIDRFETTLGECFRQAGSLSNRHTEALRLYAFSHFAESARTRFLTLISAIEATFEPEERPTSVKRLANLYLWILKLSFINADEKAAIRNYLDGLRKKSIRRLGRDLAGRLLAFKQYSGMTSGAFFTQCYDLRSRLLHGTVEDETYDLVTLANSLDEFTSDFLSQRIFGSVTSAQSASIE